MSVHEHRSAADHGAKCVDILVVSSTRTLSTDASGALIALLLEGAGHRVGRRVVVPDDVAAIAEATRASIADEAVDAVVLTGGTGVSRLDVTPEAVRPLLDRELPGFGEIFRMLSYREIGAAAMISRAFAGLAGSTMVFALPGSKAACSLAVESLILEEIGHLAHQIGKEGPPAPTASSTSVAGAPVAARPKLGVVESSQPTRAPTAGEAEAPSTGWQAFVHVTGGKVLDQRPSIPGEITTVAPALSILQQAGAGAVLETRDGRRYGLFGYPDLESPRSKVLAVREGAPHGEVVALHRFPTLTGTCVDGGGAIPYRDRVVDACEVTVGRAPPSEEGRVFAIQGDAVWIERGQSVFVWDGRKERNEGRSKQVLASLLLHWSRR